MSKASKATEITVKQAIEELEAAESKISVRNVHAIVGGDYNRVAALLKEVQEAKAAIVQAPEDIVNMFGGWANEMYSKVRVAAEEQFNASLELLNARLERAETERDDAGALVTSLSEELGAIKEATSVEIDDLKGQVVAVSKERDILAGQLTSLTQQVSDERSMHGTQMSELRQQHKDELKVALAERDAQHASVIADMKAQTDLEVEAQKKEISELQSKIADMTGIIDTSKSEASDLKASLKAAEVENKGEKKRADKAEAELAAAKVVFETELAKAKSDADASRVDVSELSKKVEDLTKAVQALKEEKTPKKTK